MAFIPESFLDQPYASERFRRIVEVARQGNPFYRRWLEADDVVPIVSRDVFLQNNALILDGTPATGSTSGSTGIPVRIAKSTTRAALDSADQELLIRWLGGRIRCTSIIHAGADALPEWMMDITADLNTQIRFLQHRFQRRQAIALTTYPTNAELLAREIIQRGIDMSFIRRVGVYAEALEPAQEALIRQAFPNAQFWTTYSSIEFGLIAIRCPWEPNFHHWMSHKLGVEVLRDDGCPCANDEVGRVVITDYFNALSPLIRYELGDLAAVGECPCGRTDLPAFSQVIGKVRGALLRRDGRRLIFTTLSVALRDIPGMGQYQVVQNSVEDIVVSYVADRDLGECIATKIEGEFGYRPDRLRTQRVERIERGANGKFYASICHC
jgi:phenylacetate-coenzyme A ligase PaaK-like adenylate-forming protein